MMAKSNTKSNLLIRDLVTVGDFLLLSLCFFLFLRVGPGWVMVQSSPPYVLLALSLVSLGLSEWLFPTVIHLRHPSSEQVLRQVTLLAVSHCALSYLVTKSFLLVAGLPSPSALFTLRLSLWLYPLLLGARFLERWSVRRYRRLGGNTRTVVLVGSDAALLPVYDFLVSDPATGYRVEGYYANHELEGLPPGVAHLGTLATLDEVISSPVPTGVVPDEVYCSLSWSKRDEIHRLMRYCDRHVVHFYFIPVFSESFGRSLVPEQIGETVGFTPYTDPLQVPSNRLLKRSFDVLLSSLALLLMLPLLPVIAVVVKLQSPGPVFFRQERTGMSGRSFWCYKFRSMHVNADSDRVQATRDDPRKFPFGSFMRRTNLDELPQFWNVLRGEMSVVGPRPHMLAHTEQYGRLIDRYMVRHFVKPGVTGWAQVTGYRGETRELWQMEGRVRRDIWYIENWSLWLDLRIIWRTARQLVSPDAQAY